MIRVEIIGRGRSRALPASGFEHWYCSTAVKDHSALSDNDLVFSLHGDSMVEPWLPIGSMVMPPTNVYGMLQFPRLNLLHNFGHVFACTPAWMIAYAIDYGAEHIHLNGIDLITPSEQRQRESIAHLAGYARACGIKITSSGIFGIEWGNYPG